MALLLWAMKFIYLLHYSSYKQSFLYTPLFFSDLKLMRQKTACQAEKHKVDCLKVSFRSNLTEFYKALTLETPSINDEFTLWWSYNDLNRKEKHINISP